jgi:hypothetical protein
MAKTHIESFFANKPLHRIEAQSQGYNFSDILEAHHIQNEHKIHKECSRSSETFLKLIVLPSNESKIFETLTHYWTYIILHNCNVSDIQLLL